MNYAHVCVAFIPALLPAVISLQTAGGFFLPPHSQTDKKGCPLRDSLIRMQSQEDPTSPQLLLQDTFQRYYPYGKETSIQIREQEEEMQD